MARFHRVTPLATMLLLACLATAQAQTSNRSVVQAPPKQAPPLGTPITPITPSTALPRAEGLPSPSPNPAGLPSLPNTTNPAAPTTATAPITPATPVPLTPPLDGTILMPSSAIGSTGTVGTTAGTAYPANSTSVMGAGGGATAPQFVPSASGYTALQLAESFLKADANRDGELSRAEFQRLSIAPASFEEMDRDRNGIVSRSEYDDGTR